MPTHQPFLTTAQGTRRFACSAVAVQAIIVNADERVLLLSSPAKNRPDEWQVISGGLEAAETVLAGVLREVREEAGPHLQVRPLGVVHAQTFHFDHHVPYMIGLYYLLAYAGGAVQSGDDRLCWLTRVMVLPDLAVPRYIKPLLRTKPDLTNRVMTCGTRAPGGGPSRS